jgi:Protein of unknown function (DUF4058)
MDPYIEQPEIWGDFHNNLASGIQAALNQLIRPNYFARLIPYVTYETLAIGQVSRTYPDVSVFQPYQPSGVLTRTRTPAPIAVLEPMPIESEIRQDFPLRLHAVEVYTVVDAHLVTVVEILSPVNKRPGHEAYEHYLRKRRQILNTANIHLVEIDLLRGGQRPPFAGPAPNAAYYVMLSRAERRPKVTVWPIRLQDHLPHLPIPLQSPDADVTLDLGQVVADVYERGAYDLQLDYKKDPPAPKLSKVEATWLKQLLNH